MIAGAGMGARQGLRALTCGTCWVYCRNSHRRVRITGLRGSMVEYEILSSSGRRYGSPGERRETPGLFFLRTYRLVGQ